MTVEKRSILPPTAIDPAWRQNDYAAEGATSPTPDSAGALGFDRHGDVAAYRATHAAVSNIIHDDGSPGFELPTGDDRGDHSDRFTQKEF